MDGSWVDICLVVPGTVHFHSNLSEPTTFLPVPTPTCLQIVISNSIHILLDSDACRFYFLIGWVMTHEYSSYPPNKPTDNGTSDSV